MQCKFMLIKFVKNEKILVKQRHKWEKGTVISQSGHTGIKISKDGEKINGRFHPLFSVRKFVTSSNSRLISYVLECDVFNFVLI